MSSLNHSQDVYIFGRKTAADWIEFKKTLTVGHPHGWNNAYQMFFQERLKVRYLDPIAVLQATGESLGEGFSIVAIQCSLIEFLEAATQGIYYRYVRRDQILGPHEYSASGEIFVSFLSKRAPFSTTFDAASAHDFYASVRCGLLHEARTKNGWRIKAGDGSCAIADTTRKIVFRNRFQNGIEEYLRAYASRLPIEEDLQRAFLRKMDDLCH